MISDIFLYKALFIEKMFCDVFAAASAQSSVEVKDEVDLLHVVLHE